MPGSFSPSVSSFVAQAKANRRRPTQADVNTLIQSLGGNYNPDELQSAANEISDYFTRLDQGTAEDQFGTAIRTDSSREAFNTRFGSEISGLRPDQQENAFRIFQQNPGAAVQDYIRGLQPQALQAQQTGRQEAAQQAAQVQQALYQQPEPQQQAAAQEAPAAPVAPRVQAVSVEPAAAPAANVGPLAAAGQPSVDLRSQQDELVRQLIQKSEAAGRDAVSSLTLPAYQAPRVQTQFGTQTPVPRTTSPLEQAVNRGLTGSMAYQRQTSPLESRLTDYYQGAIGQRPEDDPITQARLGEYERTRTREAQELTDQLNRLGIIQQGEATNVLGDFRLGQENIRQGILAEGAGRQREAAGAAQGLLGTLIGAGQGDESLRQNAISLAQQFVGSRNNLDLQEAQIMGNLRGRQTLAAQTAGAEVGLGLGQQRESARQYEGTLGLQRLGLQQDVADRTLNRLLTQTSPTGERVFQEGVRGSLESEALARAASARQATQLEQEILDRTLGRKATTAGLTGQFEGQQTLQGQLAAQDIANQILGRQATTAGITGQFAGGETLAARAQRQQDAQFNAQLAQQERGQTQQGELARAELSGQVWDPIQGRMVETIGSRQASQQAAQFAQSLGLDYEKLSQQDRQFLLEQAQQGSQFADTLHEQQATRAQQGSQFGLSLAEQVAARAQQNAQFSTSQYQQNQQFGQSLAEQVQSRLQQQGQFASAQTQQNAQYYAGLSQEDRQFLASLTEQQATRTQQGAQFAASLGLDYAQLSQQDRQFVDSQAQQNVQFGRGMTLDEQRRLDQVNQERLTRELQSSQFDATNRLQEAELLGSLDGRATLADRQLGFNYAGLSQERELADALRDLQEQELYGGTGNRTTLGARIANNQNQLARGELLGTYDGQQTLQGRLTNEQLLGLTQDRTQGRTLFDERVSDQDRLAAELFGTYQGQETLQGRAANQAFAGFNNNQLRDALSLAMAMEDAGMGTGGVNIGDSMQQLFQRLGIQQQPLPPPAPRPESALEIFPADQLGDASPDTVMRLANEFVEGSPYEGAITFDRKSGERPVIRDSTGKIIGRWSANNQRWVEQNRPITYNTIGAYSDRRRLGTASYREDTFSTRAMGEGYTKEAVISAANDLIDNEGWTTMSIEPSGDRLLLRNAQRQTEAVWDPKTGTWRRRN